MAKIASDLDKPDGLFVLSERNWLETVGEQARLAAARRRSARPSSASARPGIETVADLAGADPAALERSFGPRHGPALRDRGNGIGATSLTTERARKSESRETTFPHDVSDRGEMIETVDAPGRVGLREPRRARRSRGRTVTLKIRLSPGAPTPARRPSPPPPATRRRWSRWRASCLARFDPDAPVRLLGVGVAGLASEAASAGGPGTSSGPAQGAGPLELDLGLSA